MTNKERHYKLWNELAETGGSSKVQAFHDVFASKDVPIPQDYCFACQECIDRGDPHECTKCPLTENAVAHCLNGLFDAWCEECDPAKRKLLAAQIRDLPWKEEN